MASSTTGNLTLLLRQTEKHVSTLLAHLEAKGLPEPSFEHGDHIPLGEALPADVAAAREGAIEATHELHDLLLGPTGLIVECSGQVCHKEHRKITTASNNPSNICFYAYSISIVIRWHMLSLSTERPLLRR